MVSIKLEGQGWDTKYWDRQNKNFQRDLSLLIRRYAAELRGKVRQAAPRDRGKLQQSIRSAVRWAESRFGIEIFSDLDYAMYQEWGTGLYTEYPGKMRKRIEAKSGKGFLIPNAQEGPTELRKPFRKFEAFKKSSAPISFAAPTFKNPRKFGRFRSEQAARGVKGKGKVRSIGARFQGNAVRMSIAGVKPTAFIRRTFEIELETDELMNRIERLAALYGFE